MGIINRFGIFEESEEDVTPEETPEKEIEVPLKGFLFNMITCNFASSLGNSYSRIDNFYSYRKNFLECIMTDFAERAKVEPEDLEPYLPEIADDPLKSLPKFLDKIRESRRSKCTYLRIWGDLNPPAGVSEGMGTLMSFDPYTNVYQLDKAFTNSRAILDKYVTGNTSQELGGKEVLYEYFKLNPLMLYVLDDRPEIKAEVLEATGMRDTSRAGRIIKKGLL